MLKIYSVLLSLFTLLSCVKTPTDNSPSMNLVADAGDILVLSEGLQGYDNSTISLIKSSSAELERDYFSSSNNEQYLGDTANDMIIIGDTAYVVLSTSSMIRAINIKSGKKLKDIFLPNDCLPRHITSISDTSLCVSCLLRSSILFINLNDLSNLNEVSTGPQPEGIAIFDDYIFVANSAYGDFNYMHADAATISVISISNGVEILKLSSGVNCSELIINNENKRLYAACYNLPSLTDSLGDVIEYDLNNLTELRRWKVRARSLDFSISGDSLLFISQQPKGSNMSEGSGIAFIDLNNGKYGKIFDNPNKFDIWYGLNVSPFDGSIWVCNAREHINNGKVLVYNINNTNGPIKAFDVLLNPNKVLFIR